MVAHSIAFGAFGLPWGSLLAPLGVPQATLGCRCGKGFGEPLFWEGLWGALGSMAAALGDLWLPFGILWQVLLCVFPVFVLVLFCPEFWISF